MKLLIFMMFILFLTSCFEGQEGLFNFESEFGCSKTSDCGKNALGEDLKCYEGSCVVCIEGEEDKEASCGLNGNGFKTTVCVSNIWIDKSICEDPDECKKDEIRQNSCGLNNAGLTLETCKEGKWTANENDCINDDVCLNGEAKPANCGLNENGTQQQFCASGSWINIGDCIDDDICTNTQTRTTSCGLNDNGIQNELCINGQWEYDGNCLETDVCENNKIRQNKFSCGINQNGYKNQICQNGQWIDSDTNCFDEDVCLNNTTKLEYNSCGVNGTGNTQKICNNGQWIDNQASITGVCDDNDVCRNGDLSQTICENIGYMKLACVNGVNIPLSECKLPQTKQFGTVNMDSSTQTAVDIYGNIYIIGTTLGTFNENINIGYVDFFIAKYDNNFQLEWLKQFGTTKEDRAYSITVDYSNNIYVVGVTKGNLDGNTNQNGLNCTTNCSDAFLIKYDLSGNRIWTKQWGTIKDDIATSVKVDNWGNIFISGTTLSGLDGNTLVGMGDVFLTKFNSSGTKLWSKQWGSTVYDGNTILELDTSGNVYLTGQTQGNFDGNTSKGNQDIFVVKTDNNGSKMFSKQYGKNYNERGYSLHIDSENQSIFVFGQTASDWEKPRENNASSDIFLLKLNSSGNELFIKQFGSVEEDSVFSSYKDSFGNFYITGDTFGGLDGNVNNGTNDVYLSKIDNSGNKIWTIQWGTSWSDIGNSVNVDKFGNIFVTGDTSESMNGNQNYGQQDIFITKFKNDLLSNYENKLYSCFENDCGENGQCVNYLTNISLEFENKTQNNAICLCDYGYAADGLNCIESDSLNELCQFINCGEGICNNTIDINGNYGYECICDFGYSYNNGKCISDKCFSNNSTCSNKGFCSFDGNENYCACEIGYKENTELLSEGDENPLLCIENGNTKRINTQNNQIVNSSITSIAIDEENNSYLTGDFNFQNPQNYKNVLLLKGNENEINPLTYDLGSSQNDKGNSIKTDNNGNIYIVGETSGDMNGTNFGGKDVFLTKYTTEGDLLFIKQIGTENEDIAWDVSVDSNGNIYIVGQTNGTMSDDNDRLTQENIHYGNIDGFLSKFDSEGNWLWTKQFGTSGNDECKSLVIDEFQDIIVACNFSEGESDESDIAVIKFNSNREQQWLKIYGTTSDEMVNKIIIDNQNNFYITGITAGNLNGILNNGSQDIFVLKLNVNGDEIWTKLFGNEGINISGGIDINKLNFSDIFILYSHPGATGSDTTFYLVKIDNNGNKLWTKIWKQFAKPLTNNIAINNQNEIFIALSNETETILQKITKDCEAGYIPNNDGFCVKLKGKSCTDEMITINSSGIYSNDTSIGYSDNFSNVLCSENALGNEVIYKLEITQQPSTVTFKILNAEFNPIINIKQVCNSESIYNNNCSVSNELSSVELEPGTYYVVIDGVLSTDNGKFDLQVLFE